MPLFQMKTIDRNLFVLNENIYGIYFEDAEQKGSHPFTRWARAFERMKPLTVYERGEAPLSHATYRRDETMLSTQTLAINDLLRQGVVILFPLEDWSVASVSLSKSSPELHAHLERHIASWSRL